MPNKGQVYFNEDGIIEIPQLNQAQIDAASTTNGVLVYNSTTNRVNVALDGTFVEVQSLLGGLLSSSGVKYIQTADKTVVNTVAKTSLMGVGNGSLTIQANTLKAGDSFFFSMEGIISDTANPTIDIDLDLNSTIICTGGVTLGAITNDFWRFSGILTFRSVGAGGSVMASGVFTGGSGDIFGAVLTSPVAVNTTINQTLDIKAEWGTASASNTMTSQNFTLIKLT